MFGLSDHIKPYLLAAGVIVFLSVYQPLKLSVYLSNHYVLTFLTECEFILFFVGGQSLKPFGLLGLAFASSLPKLWLRLDCGALAMCLQIGLGFLIIHIVNLKSI